MAVSNLSYVTVTGNFQRLDGSSAEGVIRFRTNTQIVDTSSNQIVVPGGVDVELVDGAFSVSLPATNDADFSPVGFTYDVLELVDGGSRSYSILLPASPSTVDLADVTRVDAATPFQSRRGATSVANGGTIAHGLPSTPAVVTCTPSVSGEMVAVTARGASTFTVAIKKHDNTSGTTQTIYWEASL